MSTEADVAAMCADCKKLVRAGRSTKPHSNLECTEFKAVSSMLGPADETYYKCRACGHEWLHETGSQGMGWV
jgi:hypothetical protein